MSSGKLLVQSVVGVCDMVVDVGGLFFFNCVSFGDSKGMGDRVSDSLSFTVLSFILLVLLLLFVVLVVLSFILYGHSYVYHSKCSDYEC